MGSDLASTARGPYTANSTEFLYACRSVEVSANHGATKTRSGRGCCGRGTPPGSRRASAPTARRTGPWGGAGGGWAGWGGWYGPVGRSTMPFSRLPATIGRGAVSREGGCLHPSLQGFQPPTRAQDETVARTPDGNPADFASPSCARALAAELSTRPSGL